MICQARVRTIARPCTSVFKDESSGIESMDAAAPQPQTMHALRGASAAVICLICAEWLNLEHAGLAVWSTHMVTVKYQFTTFQKGFERAFGRGVGIFGALAIAALTRDAWLLSYALEMLVILVLFYIYFAGRLSYTFLNAGLYLATTLEMSHAEPDTAIAQGWDQFVSLVVGVSVATIVTWLFSDEREVKLHTEGEPLWPIQREWVLHSIMLTSTVALVLLVTQILQFSTSTTLVSVMLLTITPDYQSLVRKSELRTAGAVLAIIFASAALVLLVRRPSLPLLMAALFLGTYLAVMLARTSSRWDYAGVQMGLVLPMILVVPHHEFGSLSGAFARVGGALLAIAASLAVGLVWAALVPAAPPMPLAKAAK